MRRLRKIMLYVLTAIFTVCTAVLVAACAGTGTYADFINPATPVKPNPGDTEFKGDYTIEVKSAGGLNLSGIKVSVLLNNEVVEEGMSVDGKIELTLDPAEYTLSVDESTLPTGYFIADGAVFKTSADNGKAKVELSSAVISQSTPPGTRYSLGDVMYDFSFTDASTGERSSLSEVFKTKKAVVINFWYRNCGPCRSEFPAMQSAYANFSDDLEIIALTNHSEDTQDEIKKFRRENGLTFIMAQDGANLHTFFNILATPTTVVIDRFGAIAFWDSTGAITQTSTWVAMFTTYTSDEYQQSGADDSGVTQDWARPDASVVMPSSAEIESAINGSGTAGKVGNYRLGESEDAQKDSWPWLLGEDGGGKYLYSPNVGKNYSYSTLYVDFKLNSGDIIYYEYNINTEVDCDYLYVLLVDLEDASNNKQLTSYCGDSSGWAQENALYTANRPINITLAFSYLKDQLQGPAAGDEIVAIRNIRIITAADITVATDLVTPAVSGTVVDGKYELYENVKLNPADGYYHLYNETTKTYGALLLADILDATMWSSNVVGKTTFINEESRTTTASLYQLSYWTMSNYKKAVDDGGLIFTYDKTKDKSITDTLITCYYLQTFSDNKYVPVSEELKAVIDAFTAEYCRLNDKDYYEEQWLEMCYYFIHYGDEHKEGDCYVNTDPTFGLTRRNAYTAVEGTEQSPVANHVNVTKIIAIDGGGGVYFKLEPKHTGVYHIYTNSKSKLIDPLIFLRTPTGKDDDSFLAEFDDDMSPDKFLKEIYENVDGYVYLEAGTTYYVQCRFHQPQVTGEYDFFIEYTNKTSMEYLRFATTGEGMWTYDPSGFTYYLAIPVAQGTDKYKTYHAVNSDSSLGSKIYIDFIHPQYYDMNNHTLKEIIDEGYFDLTEIGGGDLTPTMLKFYNQAISRDKDDELYGLAEASYELVYYITNYLERRHGEKFDTGYWLAFACYYQHIGN